MSECVKKRADLFAALLNPNPDEPISVHTLNGEVLTIMPSENEKAAWIFKPNSVFPERKWLTLCVAHVLLDGEPLTSDVAEECLVSLEEIGRALLIESTARDTDSDMPTQEELFYISVDCSLLGDDEEEEEEEEA